jgi:shikimate kinase
VDLIQAAGGTTVWLDCPPEILRTRCEGLENRPLFRDVQAFTQLFAERLPYYRLADYRVSTEGRTPEEVVESILSLRFF